MSDSHNSILVLGHSFISRLKKYSHECHSDRNLGVPKEHTTIFMRGISGAKLSTLYNELQLASILTPTVIVLQIGSNDLTCPSVRPSDLCDEIFHFAKLILETGTAKVVISEIFFRNVQVCSKRRQCRSDFNQVVTETNSLLKSQCISHHRVSFWHHRNMKQNWKSLLSRDGVHFNSQGLFRYYRSMKGLARYHMS